MNGPRISVSHALSDCLRLTFALSSERRTIFESGESLGSSERSVRRSVMLPTSISPTCSATSSFPSSFRQAIPRWSLGLGRSEVSTFSTRTVQMPWTTASTVPAAKCPLPSVRSRTSPGRARQTRMAWELSSSERGMLPGKRSGT